MTNDSSKIAWAITFLAAAGAWYLLRRSESNPLSLINSNWDMRTNTKLPRGYRNNNPLNIRKSMNTWKGKIYVGNTDGVFEQFENMAYGYRAAFKLMQTYIKKYGCDTVAKIISRWAPENENNTSAYIKHVCEFGNLTPDTIVRINDQDVLTRMAYAMSIIENGNTDVTRAAGLPNMEIINEGWRLI